MRNPFIKSGAVTFLADKKSAKNLLAKFAFTLAEVLITIGIIGVVSEMTIPTLVQSYKKQLYVIQLEKFFSEFQAGAKAYYASKDCQDLACTGSFDGMSMFCSMGWTDGCPKLDDFATKSFKIAKTYNYEGVNDHPTYLLSESMGMYQYYFTNAQYSFLTADNFLVSIQTDSTDACTLMVDVCATIYVDVNGFNGPDTLGRDTFLLYLRKDGSLIPGYGREYKKQQSAQWQGIGFSDSDIDSLTTNEYWRTSGSACGMPDNTNFQKSDEIWGYGCAARIMENGWKMDY